MLENFDWVKPYIDRYMDFDNTKYDVREDYVTDVFSDEAVADAKKLSDVEMAYKFRRWYIDKAGSSENIVTLLVTFKRRSVNNKPDSIKFKLPNTDNQTVGYTVLVAGDSLDSACVYDPICYTKPIKLKRYIHGLSKENSCGINGFRYDATYLGILNFCGTGNAYITHSLLSLLDSTLGKPQCNIIAGKDVMLYGDDIIVNNMPDPSYPMVANAVNHTRMRALTNIKLEGTARSVWYKTNGIDAKQMSEFSNKELLEQDFEIYTDDAIWLGISMLG